MSNAPPIPQQFVVPSEYAPGGAQIILPPDRHRDPTPEEITERQRANRITVAEVEKMFTSKESYRFLLDRGFFGTITHGTGMNVYKPWQPPPDYFERDRVEAAMELIRVVAAGLPKR